MVSCMFDVTQQRAFSLEALCCETATQQSCKLRVPCQIPTPCFFLSCQSKTSVMERCRGWYPSEDRITSWGRRGKVSDSLQSCPSHASLSTTATLQPDPSSLLHMQYMHFDYSSKQVLTLDYNPTSGRNTQDSNWLCLFSVWKSLECSGDDCLTTRDADLLHFYCWFKEKTQLRPTISTQSATVAVHCDW